MSNYNAKLPLVTAVAGQFLGIPPHPTKCQATYVWIDGSGESLRSKTRTLEQVPDSISDLPSWNFDGSSTGQASGYDSDVTLKPIALYPDPFLGGNNRLVLCATYQQNGQPTETNHRDECKRVMDEIAQEESWFGIEQEYLLLDRDGYPLGWPKNGYPARQGPYYCGVGADRIFGRELVEAHYRACLYAGIEIGGTNAEVAPGQWEYQVGTCEGVEIGDQLWMSRYLLHRTAEQFGVLVTFDPKPSVTAVGGEWNGAGCHTNFSTATMRQDGGLAAIEAAIDKMAARHEEHLKVYDAHGGKDNAKRLSGHCETSSIDKFTWGIADRGASVRVPRSVAQNGKGYLEDRRPASNCDPYRVAAAIASAIFL